MVSLLLVVGIRESAGVNNMIVILKVSVSWCLSRSDGLTSSGEFDSSDSAEHRTFWKFRIERIAGGAGVIFFAYIGFDAVSTAAQEAKVPQRDMPIGNYRLAADLHRALHSVHACANRNRELPGIECGRAAFSGARANSLSLAEHRHESGRAGRADIGDAGDVAGPIARVFFDVADGLLPKLFCDVHPKFRTPWRCNLVLDDFCGAVRGVCADFGGGQDDQHRHALCIRDRVRGNH